MSFIAGFQLGSQLYESENSLVFRATQDIDSLPVVIKILKNSYPTLAELAHYRQEFEITQSVSHPEVIRSYELRRHEKTLLIVFEDFGGMSVSNLLEDRALLSRSSLTPPSGSRMPSAFCTAVGSFTRTSILRISIVNPGDG